MWYHGRAKGYPSSNLIGLAVSKNGVHWKCGGGPARSSSNTSTLEVEAYPALEELISQLSTLNLERVRQIKSRLVALSSRVQKVYRKATLCTHPDKVQQKWSADRGTRFVCYVISLLAGLARRNLADTEETESTSTDQPNLSNSSNESSTDKTELSSRKEEQSSNDAQ
ncbi:hypothetical protein JHK82_048432 [Glycine max]|nr:hypothetical protein JHK86_048287 [Glycine max]KAG4944274.1 hypothetical protein JHK85_048920 [Glycine max]KAG5098578.1 hypothetical protein JHK82_048432 [Glycine max]